MNKRLYVLAAFVVLLGAVSMGTVAYLQGDFKEFGKESTKTVTETVLIELSENGVQSSSNAVRVENDTVTINAGGQYEITGQAEKVNIQVSEEISQDVTIGLNNASFASLDLHSRGTNVLNLVKDSKNSLSGEETGISATNITLTGDGSLVISEVSQYGIFASDDLVLESGNLTIDSGGFGLYAFHETEGEHGNLTINGGTTHISSSQEAGAAVLASNKLTINNGSVTVTTAHEAYVGKHLVINGGTANLVSVTNGMVARDSLAKEGQASLTDLTINGGTNNITSGANPVLSNGDITIAGGINTFLASMGEQAVFNYSGSAELTGGSLIALGVVTLTSSHQEVLMAGLNGNAGDTLTITDAAGNEIASYPAPISFAKVTYSSANLTGGSIYYLSTTSGSYGQATASKSTSTTP